jgi:peptidoglycan/LPS O-acetylase OafA/YrhL
MVTTARNAGRSMSTGDEAGTAPGDRKFRPDVQGLRAVAILLVVLFHADIPGVHGGYVGVDVFFVISGFVITGVLLRERASKDRTSLRSFYGRRARRILPAASVVLVVTIVAAYSFLGASSGRETAVDGQWAAVFLANVHFALTSTNYLASQQPPSALQNYWSLAVEEQFYVVFPTMFMVAASLFTRRSLRARLGIMLVVVIVVSFVLSVVLTSSNAASAFFSPFARAWELALGCLIAVSTENLKRVPPAIAALFTWLGLLAILVATFVFTSMTEYPGSLVAVPVIGAALVIAGGTAQPRWGVESLLRLPPFQWLGLISFSLYLWHWPVLIIATQRKGATQLPVVDNLLWLLVALGLAVATYILLENPVRRAKALVRSSWASVTLGACLIIASVGVATVEVQRTSEGVSSALAAAEPGSVCHPEYKKEEAALRAAVRDGQFPKGIDPGAQELQMVVVGDSTACTMVEGLAAVGDVDGVRVADGTVIGCGVVSGRIPPYYYGGVNFERLTKNCQAEANSREDSAIAERRPNVILWGSQEERASILATSGSGNKVLVTGTPEWKAVMLSRMNARVTRFLATGAKVVLLLQPAFVETGSPTKPTEDDREFERLNGLLKDVAAAHPGRVTTINLAARVCPTGPPCPYIVDGIGASQAYGNGVRADGEHYGLAGSLWVAEWLLPKIRAFVAAGT